MKAFFRFYGELNDFISPEKRNRELLLYEVFQPTTVKDAIEAYGVPHTEVDLILVDGESRPFSYLLKGTHQVSVYPMFESFDISSVEAVRDQPLRQRRHQHMKFIVDVNLGKLAHYLRMLGFDTIFDRHLEADEELARISKQDHRILLTRDRGLLKRRNVDHGYFVRSSDPFEQAQEVLRRFDLLNLVRLCSRCMHCNTPLKEIAKEKVFSELPPLVAKTYTRFYTCPHCKKIFWEGSHFENMQKIYEELRGLDL